MATGAFNTGAQLGEMIFGNPAAGQEAYAKGQALGARARDALMAARLNRAKAIAKETANDHTQAVTTQGLGDLLGITNPAAQQAALDLLISGGSDVRKLGDAGSPFYTQNARAATVAANAGNLGDMNNHLAFMNHTPIKTTDVTSNGEVLNPYGDTNQPIHLDGLGDTVAALNTAKAGTEHAHAGQFNSHADLYDVQASVGGYNPNTGSHGKNWNPPSSLAKAYFSTQPSVANGYRAGIDQKKLTAFYLWRKDHPGTNLADYISALQQTLPRVGVSSFGALGETAPPGLADAAASVPVVHVPTAATEAPTQDAIAYLQANPQLAQAFDAKYGAGAAAHVLGQ